VGPSVVSSPDPDRIHAGHPLTVHFIVTRTGPYAHDVKAAIHQPARRLNRLLLRLEADDRLMAGSAADVPNGALRDFLDDVLQVVGEGAQ
jgi:hypothetical protein